MKSFTQCHTVIGVPEATVCPFHSAQPTTAYDSTVVVLHYSQTPLQPHPGVSSSDANEHPKEASVVLGN